MKLEAITAKVRPRMGWEAIGLGFRMVHRNWRSMFTIWFGLTLPPLLLGLIFLPDNMLVVLLVFWWLRPLFESALLNYASKALFGEYPSLKDSFKTFHKYAFKQLLQNLLWRRLSPSRSMNMAVAQLEGLSGTRRSKRIDTLHAFNSGAAIWLTLLFLFLHFLFYLNIMLVGLWLIPDIYLQDIENWWAEIFWSNNSSILQLLQVITIYLLFSFFSPFYVAGGFAIYINQRTILEAWDIELIFKQLRQKTEKKLKANIRRKVASGTALLLCLSLVFLPNESSAEEQINEPVDIQSFDHASAKKAIEDILNNSPFSQEINKERIVYDFDFDRSQERQESRERSFGFIGLLANFFELLLWLVVIGILIFLALKFGKVKSYFNTSKVTQKKPPNALFGLQLGPESLPENSTQKSWELWQQKKYREAYSLLIRATLAELISQHNCEFEDGFTELECARVVKKTAYKKVSKYFEELTYHWRLLAYGHQIPDDEIMRSLCEQWPNTFLTKPAEQANDRS